MHVDCFESFGVYDFFSLEGTVTRRAFKFRRGESPWVWSLSLMGLRVLGVRVFRGVSPPGFGIAAYDCKRASLYLTGSSFSGRLWVS